MRWLLGAAISLFIVIPLLAASALWAFFLQDAPLVATHLPPSPDDVRVTREFVHQVRAAAGPEAGATPEVEIDMAQANAVLRLGTRFLKGLRAAAGVRDGRVVAVGSLPVPWPGGGKWLNVRAVAPPFSGRLSLDELQVGPTRLPPDLSIEAGRIAANLVLGDGRGDRMLNAASGMAVSGDRLTFTMTLDKESRGDVMRGIFGVLRGGEMPGADEVELFYRKIRTAMDAGDLPVEGSFLPHIRYMLRLALDNAGDSLPNAYTAAIFGLTRACGARDFTMVVGQLAVDAARGEEPDWRTDCKKLTLNGRIDSRRHFITAGAIQAASNRGFAISVGEFKELHDTVSGAGGFDFTDLSANNSGIRMSNLFMARPAADWPALIARMQAESDVIIDYDGIPGLMPEKEFLARFKTVESPEYYRMLAKIEARIDRLPLHRSE